MHALRRRRWVALCAALALILCTALYSAHGLGDRAHEHEHCDLCVHLGGNAGSAAPLKVGGRPSLVSRVPAAPVSRPPGAQRVAGLPLARGHPRRAPAVA